jgi:phage terminase small subunit
MMPIGLQNFNDKQIRFCREYIIDHNGKQAAIRAGYSKKTAESIASRLLRNVKVKLYIKTIEQQVTEKLNIKAEDVIKELACIGFSKATDFITIQDIEVGRGKRKKIIRAAVAKLTADVEPGKLPAIAEIKQTEHGIGIKTHDKVRSLELLGKHLGIFEADNSQKGTITVEIE